MRLKRVIPVAVVLAALVVVAAFTAGGAVRAQNATPSTMMDMTAAHPIHIHNGTCATLGSIAWPLNDLSAPGAAVTMMGTPVMGTPMAAPTMAANATPMAGMGAVVAESVTTVKVNLADLEKAPFAINAHESLAKITNYIACGNITGTITGGSLTIQLNQLNNSGLTGVAMLHDNGDGTTTVSVQLMKATS
jgi:hypothetical protein